MNSIQKTVSYILDLYKLENVRALEKLIEQKNQANEDLKEIGFLKMIVGMYYWDCGSEK